MKRLIVALTSTIAGLVALFSFNSHPRHIAPGRLSATSLTSADPPRSDASTPSPHNTASAAPTAVAATKTTIGRAYNTAFGIVQVQIVTTGTHIQGVSLVQLTARNPLAEHINNYAAPILLKETLTIQSAHIDAVSGATYTSQGYRDSLQSALDKAGLR